MRVERSLIAVILAGGLGTRLRETVPDLPKVMAPVCGRPFLHHVLDGLQAQSITRVWLAVAHRGDAIRGYFGDGSRFGLQLEYADEGTRLRGTGGALRNALDLPQMQRDTWVLALNGDTFVDVSLGDMRAFHETVGARLTVGLAHTTDLRRYGGVVVDPGGAVSAFCEKGSVGPGWVNAGAYLAHLEEWREILPSEECYNLEQRVLPGLVGDGLFGFCTKGRFLDIGVPEDYARAASVLRCEAGVQLA